MNVFGNITWYVIFGYIWLLSDFPLILGAALLAIVIVVDVLQKVRDKS